VGDIVRWMGTMLWSAKLAVRISQIWDLRVMMAL